MLIKLLMKMGYTKEEASWILYDVGNSAQVLTTCTVIFPLLIAYITPGDSSVYVGWANTVYGLLLAVMSPILGTVADYKGMKMKLFRFFLYIGIIGGFALALPFIDYKLALILFVIAMLGYNGSIIFYDAFIMDVCENDERVDRVSAAGYAWGYIGSDTAVSDFCDSFCCCDAAWRCADRTVYFDISLGLRSDHGDGSAVVAVLFLPDAAKCETASIS